MPLPGFEPKFLGFIAPNVTLVKFCKKRGTEEKYPNEKPQRSCCVCINVLCHMQEVLGSNLGTRPSSSTLCAIRYSVVDIYLYVDAMLHDVAIRREINQRK